MSPTDFAQEGLHVTCTSLDLARWLHEHTTEIQLKIAVAHCASEHGNIDLIKWAHDHEGDNGMTITGMMRAMDECALLGRLDDLEWLHANRKERCSHQVLSKVVAAGSLSVAKWLRENYPSEFLSDPIHGCCDLKMANWILNTFHWKQKHAHTQWIDNAIEAAAGSHEVDLIEFLYRLWPEHRTSTGMAISNAAGCGDLAMVQLLNSHQVKVTIHPMKNAVANGHLEVVKFLHPSSSRLPV